MTILYGQLLSTSLQILGSDFVQESILLDFDSSSAVSGKGNKSVGKFFFPIYELFQKFYVSCRNVTGKFESFSQISFYSSVVKYLCSFLSLPFSSAYTRDFILSCQVETLVVSALPSPFAEFMLIYVSWLLFKLHKRLQTLISGILISHVCSAVSIR